MDEIETTSTGGRQSKLNTRYDLLPPHAVGDVAAVLAEGAAKYTEWNWLKIPSRSHLNHAMTHIGEFLKGEMDDASTSEDHAAHAACRLLMWLEMLHREGSRPSSATSRDQNGGIR